MDKPIQKLDESRPCGTAFVGPDTYFVQDGKHFHRTTKELVDPAPAAPVVAAPVTPKEQPVAAKPKLTCKLCGAKRDNPELMKEHLMAMHADEVPELLLTVDVPEKPAEPESEPQPEPEKPKTKTKKKTKKK